MRFANWQPDTTRCVIGGARHVCETGTLEGSAPDSPPGQDRGSAVVVHGAAPGVGGGQQQLGSGLRVGLPALESVLVVRVVQRVGKERCPDGLAGRLDRHSRRLHRAPAPQAPVGLRWFVTWSLNVTALRAWASRGGGKGLLKAGARCGSAGHFRKLRQRVGVRIQTFTPDSFGFAGLTQAGSCPGERRPCARVQPEPWRGVARIHGAEIL